jgi:site-specific recombinase XerD
MREHVTLGPWLRRFLCEHIVTERNLARNTRSSYRDTFSLLLPFVSRKLRKPVDLLAVCDLTSELVLQFLAHLEEDRGCSARTRNQRLAAIRAFARFIGSRDPAHVEWCGHIRAIASKKSLPPAVGWLTKAEMEAMLAVPDRKTRRGRSEYALLLFLYNTGARVSEATQLKVRDQTRSSAARAMAPYLSAGSERLLPASESIALSSVARPECRNWLTGR